MRQPENILIIEKTQFLFRLILVIELLPFSIWQNSSMLQHLTKCGGIKEFFNNNFMKISL